jgi:DUF1365 family protein
MCCVCAGAVHLLTNPISAGYVQNPISVYYCYSNAGQLQQCIAEVTNTPWGERVRFLFDPKGTSVPKCLHVSPMMDMKSTWYAVFLLFAFLFIFLLFLLTSRQHHHLIL